MKLKVVLAFLFGVVHRDVRVFHQRLLILTIPRVNADADAGCDTEFLPENIERAGDVGQDLVRHLGDIFGLAHILEQDHELVASEAGDGVGLTNAVPEPVSDLPQQCVPGVVPQRVVDILEAIEVDEQHRQILGVAARAGNCGVEDQAEAGAVRQRRQAVVIGKVLNACFSDFRSGHVLAYAAIAGEGSLCIEDRLSAYAQITRIAFAAESFVDKIQKWPMRFQYRPVRVPFLLGQHDARHFPAGLADVPLRIDADGFLHSCRHRGDTEIFVLLPVPVGGQMGKALEARLAFSQAAGHLQRERLRAQPGGSEGPDQREEHQADDDGAGGEEHRAGSARRTSDEFPAQYRNGERQREYGERGSPPAGHSGSC